MTYSWSANGGNLSATSGTGPIIWTAPNTPGTYTVTVSVTDGKDRHNPVSQSINITVISNSPHGQLSLSFDPNPAPRSSSSCAGHTPTWQFTAYLAETGGVGVTIAKFTVNFYDANGKYISTVTKTATDFANWFGPRPGSSHIRANAKIYGKLCVWFHNHSSGSVVITFYGTDDNGHNISVSLREVLSGLPSSSQSLTEEEENSMNFIVPEVGIGAGACQ